MVGALKEQAEKLIHCSNLYYHEPQGQLAASLVELFAQSPVKGQQVCVLGCHRSVLWLRGVGVGGGAATAQGARL